LSWQNNEVTRGLVKRHYQTIGSLTDSGKTVLSGGWNASAAGEERVPGGILDFMGSLLKLLDSEK